MKQGKQSCAIFILLMFMLINLSAQQSIMIIEKSGQQTSVNIAAVSKITFPPLTMEIYSNEGNKQVFSLTDLSRLSFEDPLALENLEIAKTGHGTIFYPNPVRDELTIQFGNMNGKTVHIEIYDMNGRLVLQKSDCQVSGDNQLNLSLSTLPEGIYLFRRVQALSFETIKFIKL